MASLVEQFLQLSYIAKDLLENNWIYFFTVLVGIFIATKIVVFILEKIILVLTKKTKTEFDDKLIEAARNPILILVMLYGLSVAMEPFAMSNVVAQSINRILWSVAVIVIVFLLNKIFDIIAEAWAKHFERMSKLDIHHGLLPLLQKVVKVVIFLIGLTIILSFWDIEVTPIVTSLGVAGIVLGLALQEPLSNVFSGVSLILDKAYKVGDIVVLDSGESGAVYDIGLRSTKIKSWDGEMQIIPNKKMANAVLKNIKQPDLAIKISILFGVEYGSDPERVKKVAADALKPIKLLSKEEDRQIKIIFTDFGPSSLNFKAMFWVDDIAVKWDAHQEAMTKIYKALNKAKIGIPFPITTVYLNDNTKK